MQGPYRDLGRGLARLAGPEGARRSPSRITSIEHAARELVRNARDAGARNILVASTLKRRRYRTLTVIDDGCGIPEPHRETVFEPGVTSRHLKPVTDEFGAHGAGLSLYHIRRSALHARVLSTHNPTSIQTTFDTQTLPERTLQSASRPSNSNLQATLSKLARKNPGVSIFLGTPSTILARLLEDRIIQKSGSKELRAEAERLGLEVSLRTVQRVLRGEVEPAGRVREGGAGIRRRAGGRGGGSSGPVLRLEPDDVRRIGDILSEAARASYLAVDRVESESGPGYVSLRVRVYEPEEEYDE